MVSLISKLKFPAKQGGLIHLFKVQTTSLCPQKTPRNGRFAKLSLYDLSEDLYEENPLNTRLHSDLVNRVLGIMRNEA